MRRRLTLTRETLSELSLTELSVVVGAAATGEWTCDVSESLVRTIIDISTPTIDDPCNP